MTRFTKHEPHVHNGRIYALSDSGEYEEMSPLVAMATAERYIKCLAAVATHPRTAVPDDWEFEPEGR